MEIERFLDRLEEDIKRLKGEYDQYFAGVLKREPYHLREEIERAILQQSRRRINNTALRFRFNALVARFNSYKTYWNKMLKRIEEGEWRGRTGRDDHEEKRLKALYLEYIEARKRCNQPVDNLTYEAVADRIRRYIDGKGDVDIKVRIKKGKAVLTVVKKG